jgi:hypothetical protein
MRGGPGAASANDIVSASRQEQIVKPIELKPLRAFRIVARAEVTANYAAVEIDQYVMVFAGADVVRHDAFEHGSNGIRRDTQPSFLENLSSEGLFEALTRFDQATGQRPVALERGFAALDEQDT